MTAQATDTVTWAGESWALLSAPRLFDPADHGIAAVAATTASWRGSVARYDVRDDRLILARVEVGLAGDDALAADAATGPLIAGKPPIRRGTYGWRYDLDLAIGLDGSLLLGADFIASLYVHMGVPPVWKFERVFDLAFEAGRLVEATDRSATYAEIRARETAAAGPGVPPSPWHRALDRIRGAVGRPS